MYYYLNFILLQNKHPYGTLTDFSIYSCHFWGPFIYQGSLYYQPWAYRSKQNATSSLCRGHVRERCATNKCKLTSFKSRVSFRWHLFVVHRRVSYKQKFPLSLENIHRVVGWSICIASFIIFGELIF